MFTNFDISNIEEIPTLPFVLQNLKHKVNSIEYCSSDVLRIICRDPAMSSAILKAVNTSIFSCPKLICSIPKAITLMGYERVVNIALSASVFPITKENNSIEGFNLIEFWKHSIAAAIAAETISEEINAGVDEEAFIGGLLHDIGKIVIAHKSIKNLAAITSMTMNKEVTFYEAELIFGLNTHAKIGAELAESWSFPDSLKSIIQYHHSPFESQRHQKQVMIAYLADFMARSLQLGNGGDKSINRVMTGVLIELEIQMHRLKSIYQKVITKING